MRLVLEVPGRLVRVRAGWEPLPPLRSGQARWTARQPARRYWREWRCFRRTAARGEAIA